MTRLVFTVLILMTLLANGYGQDDTAQKKDGDSVLVNAATDTARTTYDTTVAADTTTIIVPSSPKKSSTKSDQVYKLNLAVDIPLTAVTAGWSLYAFPKIY